MRYLCLVFIALAALPLWAVEAPVLVKEKDVIIYQDDQFYSTFPSVVTRPDGELIVAFRRAPDRKIFGESTTSHCDPNSYLMLVRSKDLGQTWTKEPELILAHPLGGSQDPCLIQLRDGSLVCTSYGWAELREGKEEQFDVSLRHGNFVFLGGYLMRSEDAGYFWQGPIVPPPVPGTVTKTVLGQLCPAYNRGPLWESRDGRLLWAVAAQSQVEPRRTEVHLMTSKDGGRTWDYACPIASSPSGSFNETALYETPKGDIFAFLRSEGLDDHTAVARSTDGGKSFQPWQDAGFQGHPHCAVRLPDGRALLVYGYRHAPFGIRARVLDPECTDFATAPEFVLRDDGASGDLGYPWVTLLPGGRILAVYYFNQGGTRYIAGTLLTYSPPIKEAKETVVFVHGMGGNQKSMDRVQDLMASAGYNVLSFPYSSRKTTLDELSQGLRQYVEANVHTDRYHFVAHSLGNIIIRNSFKEGLRPGLGRIVMLAPPNHPPKLAASLQRNLIFRSIGGDSGQKMASADFYAALPIPSAPFGVISGNRGQGLTFRERNDSIITVDDTKLPGMTDWLCLPYNHTLLTHAKDTAQACLLFLRSGSFSPTA